MNESARRLGRRVPALAALAALAAHVAFLVFAPLVVHLELAAWLRLVAAWSVLGSLDALAVAVVVGLSVRRHGPTLRALAAGAGLVEPWDLEALHRTPRRVVVELVALASAAHLIALLAGVRTQEATFEQSLGLFALGLTLVGGAALPLWTVVREATQGVLELAPIEVTTEVLDGTTAARTRQRTISRLALSVAAPITLVALGATLTTREQVRSARERERRETALVVARSVAQSPLGPDGERDVREVGRHVALAGFVLRGPGSPPRADDPPIIARAETDVLVEVAALPVASGRATALALAVALVAASLAAFIGVLLGRALVSDLALSADVFREIGAEDAAARALKLAAAARTDLVHALARSIADLGGRFALFARGKERALAMRGAAERMRGLLFASVSHDLKSPLSGILGLADVLATLPLEPGQQESVALVRRRARELLALIETILDATRVETGQLDLLPREGTARELVEGALDKARDLAADVDVEVDVELPADLAPFSYDPVYAPRALAAILGYSMRVAGGRQVLVRVGASANDEVTLDVEVDRRTGSLADLEELMSHETAGRGRGITLGLSLAKSVLELHGGSVEVENRPDGRLRCRVLLPLAGPAARPSLPASSATPDPEPAR